MSKILAFAGSNSSSSINFKLVNYTSSLIKEYETTVLNMANFPFPMYSEDYEKQNGFSNSLIELLHDIKSCEGLILSVNEHNGNLSAYTKNLTDWLSRIEKKYLEDTKVLLMSTSPGKGAASKALEIAEKALPFVGGEIISTFSLPSFSENFDKSKGILDATLAKEHQTALEEFLKAL